MTTLLVSHPSFLEHDTGPYHPERPDRLRAVLAALDDPAFADLARVPALNRFAPELVIISAGFDAHAADPLAQLEVETEDFIWLTEEFLAIEFADHAVVHVPVSQIHFVQKYVGGFRGRPKLKPGPTYYRDRPRRRVCDRRAAQSSSRSSGQQLITRSTGMPASRAWAIAVSAYCSSRVEWASLSSANRQPAPSARFASR